ncbi:elongation of very long chain fatty acids protein-like isoform X1 [Penaeus monodon]|uniref:elongation of very long chain fatty acids protein-like isoform X1 n=1 Tax=Penaeus monodon TaxID=6687 RepID=UPI0018A6F648|nr:elongation of very long chain fatty acids protein-like isoform X1 [Penaeus monodon]
MAPCQNNPTGKLTPETQGSEHKETFRDEEKEKLSTLRRTTKFGIAVTLGNFLYGHFLVASDLPRDHRQDPWLLTKSPLPTVALSLLYVLGVTWIGPKLMAKRKPFEGLRNVMVAYNAVQVVYSAWLVYELGMGGWFGSYSFRCQTCDFSDDPMAVRMMHASYWYYFSKFVDFLDTIFFVLHKKYEHISVLHVCHHSLMPVSMWYGVRYQPGGHNTLMGLLNSFVHVVMYGYYLLAAMGPKVRPYLWWKKHVTTLQMVQFITVIVHALQLTVADCPGVPPALNLWVGLNALMFLGLFADFYVKSYREKRASQKQKAQATSTSRVPEAPLYSKIQSKLPPNSVAGTAYQTLDLCEKMALRSRLGAI